MLSDEMIDWLLSEPISILLVELLCFGIRIHTMGRFVGYTYRFGHPAFVIDVSGGGGSSPVMPENILSWTVNKLVLRNYEGIITFYTVPDNYQSTIGNNDCEKCTLQVVAIDTDDLEPIGIEKLLSETNETVALIPQNNERIQRRND